MFQHFKPLTKSSPSRLSAYRTRRQADSADPREWTQAGLARKVGASVRSVKAWEAGDAIPRPYNLRRLAKALGVSVSDLGFSAECSDEPSATSFEGAAAAPRSASPD